MKPIEFKQCSSILKVTTKKAKNIHELKDLIGIVSDESIFHHTYQYFLKGKIREYTNDFAYWAGENLKERELAEQLSSIDPYEFKNISELREKLLAVIDNHGKVFPVLRDVVPGEEFYFNETITFIYPVGLRARNLAEFLIAIRFIDASSIYYHFYEARTRLGGLDEFSKWLEESLGKKEVADKIRAIDPFMHMIEGIREHIIEAVEEEVRKDMETMGV